MSAKARAMVVERGAEDWESEFRRFPRLFQGHESIPGLTWPTLSFDRAMTVFMGRRRVDLRFLGRAHTAGDIVAHVPDANVMFTGDIVEYRSACYCGDAHFGDWAATLEAIRAFDVDAIAPGRGGALIGRAQVNAALDSTAAFVRETFRAVARVALGGGALREAMAACREACDPQFGDYAIYEHCLPFNVSRAWDEALGIDTPRIWTAARDAAVWAELQG